MAIYSYRALNERGRKIQGQLTAGNERELYHLLQENGLELISCRDQEQRRTSFSFGGGITTRMLIQLCVQLEQMLRAGVPLREALKELRNNAAHAQLRDVLSEVARDVGDGKSLSEAFARHPKLFGMVFVTLVEAGEQTGRLDEALAHLHRHLTWTDDMVGRTKKAIRYPAFMALMVVGVTMFMMLFVVPQVVDFLQSNGEELPMPTVALIATSGLFTDWWLLFLGLPVVAGIALLLARRFSPEFALRTDHLLLVLPGIGPILRRIDLGRFVHMLAIMQRTGIPILKALEVCGRLVRNRGIREAIELINDRIATGESLSKAMAQSGVFPSIAVRMVTVGETSGELGRMLDIVGDDFDRETDEAIQKMIGLIEPALTLIMGGMMAWIAIAVFGPVYDSLSSLDF